MEEYPDCHLDVVGIMVFNRMLCFGGLCARLLYSLDHSFLSLRPTPRRNFSLQKASCVVHYSAIC